MPLSLHQTTISTILSLCLVSAAHATYPPPDSDSVGIGGGLTFRTTPDNPLRDLVVGFEVGAYVPVYAHDGEYTSNIYAAATVGTGVHIYPLITGNVTSAFVPVSLTVGLNADASYPPSPEYTSLAFTSTNSASITLTSSDLEPTFQVDSALNLDLSLGGAYWLKYSLPVMKYQYSSDTGMQYRTLGLELDLFSDDKNCKQTGCDYTTGFWRYSVATIPEPASYAYALTGLLLMGLVSYRRKHRCHEHDWPKTGSNSE
ncbi:MAG: hypothetical protein Q7U28_10110 [Aquabacterium sp.]|nr:hypothetical protein [Aquabacterium sp.]